MAKKNRKETEIEINLRVWKDPAFKSELKKNPHAALKKIGMKNVPEKLDIVVVEEVDYQWVIRLYQKPDNAERLTKQELDQAASGDLDTYHKCR